MCIWEDQQSRLDKDTKATLELTREMTSWPRSPPKEFKADLKADLTHQVVEQQKKGPREEGRSGVPQFSAPSGMAVYIHRFRSVNCRRDNFSDCLFTESLGLNPKQHALLN